MKQGVVICGLMLSLGGCSTQATGVATNPPVSGAPESSASANESAPGGVQQSGTRTVLSPLGLNVRATPSTSGSKLGATAQGAQLTVLGYSADGGGWYHIQGATMTGWITADPSLSAQGSFVAYSSVGRGFGVLYPTSWTFAEEPNDVVFRPQTGTDSMVVRTTAAVQNFGPSGAVGYVNSGDTVVVVCGVTGDLLTYDQSGSSNATPVTSTAPLQAHLAQIRLKLDGSHALSMDYSYADAHAGDAFGTFYNSMTFPFPQCQKPAPPSPSPT